MSHETVNSVKNTNGDTCALNLGRYEFSAIFAHIVVIGLKSVKLAKNTICDTCALNWTTYELSDSLAHIVLKEPQNGQIS